MTPTPTHPSTIITKPIKKASALPCPERGLLWYMLDNVDSQGLFEQHIDVIAKAVGSTHATVYRWQDNLVNRGYVEVVKKAQRRVNGKFMTAAILRPALIPVPRLVDSATQPVDSVNESTRGLGQCEESKDIQPNPTPQKRQLVDLVPPSPNGLLEALPIEERKNSTVYRLDSNSATCSTTTCMPVDSVVRDTQPPDIGPDPVVELLRKSGAKYMGVPPKPTQSDIRQQIADLQAKLAHYIAADQRSAIAGFPNAWTRYVEETWGEIARLEKEQYGHVETKRELNAQNPKLYNENGGYKHGLSYPCTIDENGVSQYDPDLVPDCSVCRVEGCWVTTSESGDRFTVGFTCGSPACNETREKMLRDQKEFDEAISDDEIVSARDGAAL